MTSLVMRQVRKGRVLKLRLVPVVLGTISEGVLKLERVKVICPGCGQQVEAVATDGQVKGYCAVAKQYVDFLIEPQRARAGNHFTAEAKAKISATRKKPWQDPEYRAKQIATHIGRHPTAETKAKISAALTRRHNTERGVNERPS